MSNRQITSIAALRILLLVLALFSSPLRADECDQLPLPSVTVKRLDEPVILETRYSHKALSVLSAKAERGKTRTLGLTRGEVTVSFDVKMAYHIDRSGRWECASPQLVLTYGFNPVTVYVAKEFPEGSCAYGEIYTHELRHVSTYQEHLARIEPDLVDTLTRRFATGGPWRGPVGQIHNTLQKELEERWVPYIQREIGRVESAQALIDTPEEYERVSNLCDGEIRRLSH